MTTPSKAKYATIRAHIKALDSVASTVYRDFDKLPVNDIIKLDKEMSGIARAIAGLARPIPTKGGN